MANRTTVREVFERGTQAFNAHDVDAFVDTMADDVSTRAPGDAGFRGREAVKAFYQSWIDAFPDAHVDIEAVHILDDVAVEEGVFSGTHRGTLRMPGGDLPATGRSVRAEYMQVLRFRGDQITSTRLVFDRLELLEQLGVAPSAGAEAAPEWRREMPHDAASPH